MIRELFLKGWLILCSCWSELFNVVVMFCLCSIKPIWNHIVLTGFQWDLPKTLFRLKDISANFARPNYRLMKKQKKYSYRVIRLKVVKSKLLWLWMWAFLTLCCKDQNWFEDWQFYMANFHFAKKLKKI